METVPAVEECVKQFHEVLHQGPPIEELPDIPNILMSDWYRDDIVNDEDFSREIVKSLKDTDETEWSVLLQNCTSQQVRLLEEFVGGSKLEDIFEHFDFDSTRGSRQEFSELEKLKPIELPVERPVKLISPSPIQAPKPSATEAQTGEEVLSQQRIQLDMYDEPGSKQPVLAYVNANFHNWGHTVNNRPQYTCVPKTRYGIQQIVKFAEKNGLNVRVSGYRHSWSPLFARNRDSILISTVDLYTASALPNTESLKAVFPSWNDRKATNLNKIEYVERTVKKGEPTLIRVGCATTNEQLRSWCIKNKYHTLPLNVIMVEITLGGSNAPICHGAGRRHKTLSDLVEAIEYVDAHGELRTITKDDGDFLLAASGCFGLIGVITELTLKVEPMTFAVMKPLKVDVIDAIPPPSEMLAQVPPALYKKRTPEQIARSQRDFEIRATEHYYAEWFWFPYSDKVWINTWQNTKDGSGVEDYPGKCQIAKHWIEAIAMEGVQNLAKHLFAPQTAALLRTTAVTRAAMASLPDNQTIKAWLPDALHFRRAIQNTRVRDLEIEIPLPPRQDDKTKPDYKVVQKAWWDAIITTYRYSSTCPMRMPLEMRIMGDSDILMAPQRGNKLGTCAIEIITLQSCAKIWPAFAQDILNQWMELRNFEGHKLNIRPHWAKEWFEFKVDGKSMIDYLKTDCYAKEIEGFKDILTWMAKKYNWTRADIMKRFSNDLLDKLFFDDLSQP